MEREKISLFDAPDDVVVLPQQSGTDLADEQSKLISEDINNAILGREVKLLILPEETNIQTPNYVLDFTDYNEITLFQKEALSNLIATNGDTSIYLYNKKGLIRIGFGAGYKLENLMILTRKHIFHDAIHIYRNVERDKPLEEVLTRDISRQRLNL